MYESKKRARNMNEYCDKLCKFHTLSFYLFNILDIT